MAVNLSAKPTASASSLVSATTSHSQSKAATTRTIRLFSWNVNGVRAVLKKDALLPFIQQYQPDILCLQETKAQPHQAAIKLPAYQQLWHSATRAGYSGTAILTKPTPLQTILGFPEALQVKYPWQDDTYGTPLNEGRILTAEYPDFYLVNVYTPNSKPDLSRLELRHQLWDPAFLQYLQSLEQHKPVIACGDFNAAHTAIDLARPQQNAHNAGFTPEERQGIDHLVQAGFIDSFRALHPQAQRYTWWSHWGHARANNVGWRIDYFFISTSLLPYLKSAEIYESITGSDHCPISITLELPHV